MNLGEFFGGIGTVDLLIILYFIGFFVLGFAQGTISRLIGILSILFSFLFAASLNGPLGSFLADHWTQFVREYSYMIAFGTGLHGVGRRPCPDRAELLQTAATLPEGPVCGRDPGRRPRRPAGGADLWRGPGDP